MRGLRNNWPPISALREPVAGEPGDLLLLRRELLARLERALAPLRAGGDQLAPGALGERLHPDLGEHLLGRPEPLARLAETRLAAQPLSVHEMAARELGPAPRPAEPLDRLAIRRLGGIAIGEKRPRTRLDAEREVATCRLRGRREPVQRIARELRVADARGGLDQLEPRPHRQPGKDAVRVRPLRAADAASS